MSFFSLGERSEGKVRRGGFYKVFFYIFKSLDFHFKSDIEELSPPLNSPSNQPSSRSSPPKSLLSLNIIFSLPLADLAPFSSSHTVTIRLQPIGAAPQLRQRVFRVSSSNRFETVVMYLRRKLGAETGGTARSAGGAQSVFCYVNNTFAPGLDEGVGGLWRVSFFYFSPNLYFIYNLHIPNGGAGDVETMKDICCIFPCFVAA